MDGKQRCINCRFHSSDIVDGYEALTCHRYAPRMLSGAGAGWSNQLWPVVSTNNWCGEWEQGEDWSVKEKDSGN